MDAQYAEVAIGVPLRRTFTYRVPEALSAALLPGTAVVVPFLRRTVGGFVGSLYKEGAQGQNIKEVISAIEQEPFFPQALFDFLHEAADYYLHPLGEVLATAGPPLPPSLLRKIKKKDFDSDTLILSPPKTEDDRPSNRRSIGDSPVSLSSA